MDDWDEGVLVLVLVEIVCDRDALEDTLMLLLLFGLVDLLVLVFVLEVVLRLDPGVDLACEMFRLRRCHWSSIMIPLPNELVCG